MNGSTDDENGGRFSRARIHDEREDPERQRPVLAERAPTLWSELYELERLVSKYPTQARRLVAALDGDR
ncbi:MAG: hypothetical protein ACRDP6_38945 [Actinoallomurus sp.]